MSTSAKQKFADQSGTGYNAISKQFQDIHSTRKKILSKWKTFEALTSLPGNNSQGQTVQCSEKMQKTPEVHLRVYSPELAV